MNEQHLELAKKIATVIWTNPKAGHHPDYIAEKLAKLEKVNTKIPENVWYIINLFEVRDVLKLWHLAKVLFTKPKKSVLSKKGKPNLLGLELANFIEVEYFEKLEKEMGVKMLDKYSD
jgi:hypothetical protein